MLGFLERAYGRDGADRRRRRRATAASSSRRRSSPASGSATRSSSARCSGRSSRCSASPTTPRRSRWANDVPYGLAASVWTRDVGRALSAARALQFGTVWINDHIPLVSEMPHGGYKQSGYGKDLSAYSLEDYTQIKHVMAKLG